MGFFDIKNKIDAKMAEFDERFKKMQDGSFGKHDEHESNIHHHHHFNNEEKEEVLEEEVAYDSDEEEPKFISSKTEFDYPVIMERMDTSEFVATPFDLDLNEVGDSVEECLFKIGRALEKELQFEIQDMGEMPHIPTVEELEAKKQVQKYLSRGMKIKIAKVKLDLHSLQEDENW
ncbi:MAG: hypothetical protein AB7S44_03480 [Spirochaetales bacterium]